MNGKLWKRVLFVGVVVALLVIVAQAVMAQSYPTATVAVSPLEPGMTDDGVEYDRYDIVVRETYSTTALVHQWYKLFDGEDFGLGPKHTIMSMSIQGYYGSTCGLECVDGIYMTFGQDAIKVPGITPKVLGQDIVLFTPVVSVTAVVGGNFELVFDGSDVGLTTASEKIEALDYWPNDMVLANDVDLPEDCVAGIFFINTLGAYRVPAANGGTLSGNGSDVLLFCATNVGPSTAGFWFRVHDEADYPINPHNAINGIEVFAVLLEPVDEEDTGILVFDFTVRTPFTSDFASGVPGQVFFWPECCPSYAGPYADLNEWPALNGVAGAFDEELPD